MTRLMLAIYLDQRKPRRVARDDEEYARTWARRWWVVEVDDAEVERSRTLGFGGPADLARMAIRDADSHVLPRAGGARVIDTGRNARGGQPPSRRLGGIR